MTKNTPKKIRKFTIMIENPDSRSSYLPIRDDKNSIMFFPTANEAYDYYVNKHWSDEKRINIVEFHDFEIKLKETV